MILPVPCSHRSISEGSIEVSALPLGRDRSVSRSILYKTNSFGLTVSQRTIDIQTQKDR
ncbi:hypothetical protein V0288_19565 [Pannus brasiliensis CCIBt3594]|uniref:Uncharacterized protein n=1 Tax=Pannus brasiliensis CCIBt3594 TaxID=1427578 RepID=A0AAW9R0V6_9CHRO